MGCLDNTPKEDCGWVEQAKTMFLQAAHSLFIDFSQKGLALTSQVSENRTELEGG